MANNSHTVMICTDALRQDTNNMWRGLVNPLGIPYDDPDPVKVNTLPGTQSVPLASAAAIAANPTPWTTPPTHWMASSWELPSFADLIAQLKAGNIPSRDWAPFNLNQNRARIAGQSLYSRTQDWDPNGTKQTHEVVAENINSALAELGLARVPSQPRPI